MKKLLILVALAGGAYHYLPSILNASSNDEVFLFTFPECGAPCRDAREHLEDRVAFTELDVRSSDANLAKFKDMGGKSKMPFMVIGNQVLHGYNPIDITTALSQTYGFEGVTSKETAALERNFDASGEPLLIMYATQTCGYCTRARSYMDAQNIEYIELDIDRDTQARADYRTLSGGGTPLFYNGFVRQSGFNQRSFKKNLNI